MNQTKKILELDGFRTIALLLVVFFHLSIYTSLIPGFDTIIAGGWMGVSLFFILSSFLLSLPYANAAMNDQPFPNIFAFYKNRFLRIIPLYYFSLFVFFLCQLFQNHPIDLINLFQNILFLGESYKINPVIWSLKVEMIFYFIFPFIWFPIYSLIIKKYFYTLVLFLSLSVIVPLFYRIWLLSFSEFSGLKDVLAINYISVLSNFDSFSYGLLISILYVYLNKVKIKNPYLLRISVIAFIFLTIISFYFLASYKRPVNQYFSSPYSLAILNLIFSLCILLTLILKKSWWNSLLTSRIMVFISTISYSVYIFHFWIFHLVDDTFSYFQLTGYFLSIMAKIISLIFIFGVSIITYKTIELPFLKMKMELKK